MPPLFLIQQSDNTRISRYKACILMIKGISYAASLTLAKTGGRVSLAEALAEISC